MGKFWPPGAQKPLNGFWWNLEYITTSGYDHTCKSIWRCDNAGGLSEHITCHMFRFLSTPFFFGQPFVKQFAHAIGPSTCPVLSVCDVGVLWPNGWKDQDETWHVGRPQPRPHCVRWGSSSPQTGGTAPHFSAHVYCSQTGGGLRPCQVASWSTQPFSHNTWAEMLGAAVPPFWGGELVPHPTQCRLGRGLPPYQVASWSIQHLATTDMGWKLEAVPFGGGTDRVPI